MSRIRGRLIQCSQLFAAGALVSVATVAFSGDLKEIVVEATPVQKTEIPQNTSGGAEVDLLSVRYRVSLAGLDLTKQADVAKLQDEVKAAAKKGCETIRKQYPVRSLSDEQSCEKAAAADAMPKVQEAIAAAQRNAKQ